MLLTSTAAWASFRQVGLDRMWGASPGSSHPPRAPSLAGFSSLDASRPWICFWIIHSLALLGAPLPETPPRRSVIDFLAACQHPTGGFGGGPFQLPHLATTYAAVASLVTLGGAEALDVIDRPGLSSFLLSMCAPGDAGGGMTMHAGGEVDIRGCYCALAAAHMAGLDPGAVADACSLEAYVAACQGMEGGIGGEPGNEAHGGYAFCGAAALALAGRGGGGGAPALAAWASRMQGWMEGGFMGRTCKLVDGCYSLWQGGVFPVLAEELRDGAGSWVFSPPPALSAAEAAEVDAALADADFGADLAAVRALDAAPPGAAAAAVAEAAQRRVDVAVEDSLRYEEQYKAEAAAGSAHAEVRKADALMALEEAADAQESLERATDHAASAAAAAATLLEGVKAGLPEDGEDVDGASSLYDPLALQLWLLAACQVDGRGGLRDKPGKSADFYHTCYCLSGLASAQAAAGTVLGGEANRLAPADTLCNVTAEALAAARAHFGCME